MKFPFFKVLIRINGTFLAQDIFKSNKIIADISCNTLIEQLNEQTKALTISPILDDSCLPFFPRLFHIHRYKKNLMNKKKSEMI